MGHTLTAEGRIARDTYCQYRRMIHPSYEPGPRWDNLWNKLGRMFEEFSIDPAVFMEAQFKAFSVPMPSAISGSYALQRYKEFRTDPEREISTERRFNVEREYVRTRRMLGWSFEDIIQSTASPLSPVFKCCLAASIDNEDLMNRFLPAAVTQMRFDSSVKKVYADLLPRALLKQLGGPIGQGV